MCYMICDSALLDTRLKMKVCVALKGLFSLADSKFHAEPRATSADICFETSYASVSPVSLELQ